MEEIKLKLGWLKKQMDETRADVAKWPESFKPLLTINEDLIFPIDWIGTNKEGKKQMSKEKTEPFEVFLGSGRVLIASYSTTSGVRGVVLRDTGVEHKIGSPAGESDYEHKPVPGEVYIRCGTRESALVLLEQVARVVASFSEPVFPDNADSPTA